MVPIEEEDLEKTSVEKVASEDAANVACEAEAVEICA